MTRRRLHLVVTAGPTREPLDPLRYLTNYSTGTMGYTVAAAARRRRHRVTLITGPSTLPPPRGATVRRVITARQMLEATMRALQHADALVMTAAVADYRPSTVSARKITRRAARRTLTLIPNPDVVALVGARYAGQKLLVGFALEGGAVLQGARRKLRRKRLDLIVGNTIRPGRVTFGDQPLTDVILLTRDGALARRRRATKPWVARRILDFIEQRCGTQAA